MDQNTEITAWLMRLGDGNGNEDACNVLWQQYFTKLCNFARGKLQAGKLRLVDEEDIAISAMNSFCQGMQKENFRELADRVDLWKLLVTITARKVTKYRRHEYAEKRGGGQVRGESVFMQHNASGSVLGGIDQVLGSEPTPELAEGLVSQCSEMLDQLEDEMLRRIAVMTLEGYRPGEIAEQLGCARRTVERKLERIREKWSKETE